ncbi:MAG: hypothetical protein ABEN55_10810, partial [Bradymonadaceae bacterium]
MDDPADLASLTSALREEAREASERAFREAARNSEAVWQDLLWLSTELHRRGVPDASTTAYKNGLAKMKKTGIASSRIRSLSTMQMALMFPPGTNHPVHTALDERNVDEVDRLSRRIAELFPNVEGGADWFQQRQRPDLALQWKERADANREANRGMLRDRLKAFDYYLLAVGTVAIALAILAFVIGLRGGLTRARRSDGPSDVGLGRWLPDLRWRDLIGPVALCVILVAISYAVNAELYTIQRLAETPGAVATDSLASPVAVAWLESLEESPARRKLLETASAEQQALITGNTFPDKRPVFSLVVKALEADAWRVQQTMLWRGQLPQPRDLFDHDFTTQSTDGLTAGVPWWALGLLFGLLVAIGAVGAITGLLLP